VIKSISGNNITLTVPLTDALDKKYMSPYLSAYTPPPTSAEIGLEDSSMTLSPSCAGMALDIEDPCNSPAISVNYWPVDSYIRRVNLTHFNNFITAQRNASRITIANVAMYHDNETNNSASYPADILIAGSQGRRSSSRIPDNMASPPPSPQTARPRAPTRWYGTSPAARGSRCILITGGRTGSSPTTPARRSIW